MWNGKSKALTFSFDDGQIQDIRLANLFNKYNLKATFNVSSGLSFKSNYPDYRNSNWNYATLN